MCSTLGSISFITLAVCLKIISAELNSYLLSPINTRIQDAHYSEVTNIRWGGLGYSGRGWGRGAPTVSSII